MALFLNKLDTVLENPSKYVRPHPFYYIGGAVITDEVVEKGGVYSFSCKSGKDRTSMAVEVRAVHFAIKAVNMVFEEIRSTTDTFDSNLIKLARQKLEKLKVKVIHKKVSELTPAQVKEFYSVYGFTKSRKPQWYTKMHPDLQRLLDQALSKCFVADGKALNIDDADDYNLIKQKLDIHLGWDSPLGQYLPIATNLFKIEFRASMYDRVILFETAFRHGALVKNEMMGDPPEIQRVSNLIYGK